MKYWIISLSFICISLQSNAQEFSFEDADSTPIKRYASQKVLNASPNKFISIGYEYQGGFNYFNGNAQSNIRSVSGVRAAISSPVISNNKLIVNLGANYWRSGFDVNSALLNMDMLRDNLSKGLTNLGVSATVFKPLNEENFLIIQASADANYFGNSLSNIHKQTITWSGSAIYGWKKSDNLMWGLGVSRTYRMGRLIYVPVLLYNNTFNNKWGTEIVFPARAHLRHNINPKSLLMFGYELEGNQFAVKNNDSHVYLQRGEIKSRLIYERSLSGFWWISIQAGIRLNGRFVMVDTYDGGKKNEIITPNISNPLYFNIGLHLVSL